MADGMAYILEDNMETTTLTLTDFLLARIAEDEEEMPDGFDCWYEPDRYRREAEAKRRIVESVSQIQREAGETPAWDVTHAAALTFILRLLAMPYADHPDYREEWRA